MVIVNLSLTFSITLKLTGWARVQLSPGFTVLKLRCNSLYHPKISTSLARSSLTASRSHVLQYVLCSRSTPRVFKQAAVEKAAFAIAVVCSSVFFWLFNDPMLKALCILHCNNVDVMKTDVREEYSSHSVKYCWFRKIKCVYTGTQNV